MDIETIDELYFQRGKSLKIDENYSFKHPTIAEISDFLLETGYDYYSCIAIPVLGVLDCADILWCESKIWYEDIGSEWDFFLQKIYSSSERVKGKLFDKATEKYIEVDIQVVSGQVEAILNFFLQTQGKWCFLENKNEKFSEVYLSNLQEDNVLGEKNLKFTEYYFGVFVNYLKKIHWSVQDYPILNCGTKFTAKKLLEKDYKLRTRRNVSKNKKNTITLSSINSSIIAKGYPLSTWVTKLLQ